MSLDASVTYVLELSIAGALLGAFVLGVDIATRRWAVPRYVRLLAIVAALRFVVPLASVDSVPTDLSTLTSTLLAGPGATSASAWPELTSIGLVWAIGAIAFSLVLGFDLLRISRLRRRTEVDAEATEVALALIPGRVEVRRSNLDHSPFVVGFRRPAIVIPRQWDHWDVATRQIVLEHEAAHVANNDYAWRLVCRLAAIVHWFNPVAWLIGRVYDRWSELHCDQIVLDRTSLSAFDYSRALLTVAEDVSRNAPAGATFLRHSDLRRRIDRLTASTLPGRRLAGPLLASLAVFVLAITSVRAVPKRPGLSPTIASVVPLGGLSSLARHLPGRRIEVGHSDHEKAVVVSVTLDMAGSVLGTEFAEGACPEEVQAVDDAVRSVHWGPQGPVVRATRLSIITDYREGHSSP